MDDVINTIQRRDCVAGMNALAAGSIDLAFADPPFNIGHDYDVYDDSLGYEKYLAWSRDWIAAIHRVLKPDGTFWLAIGDEFAAELKLESQKIGFHTRSWVVWYYTFGVNCTKKFTRSHAHLFYFVKDPRIFTFGDDDPANRIPSARQLVYNDNRANPRGRLPDDTWIIRPADAIGQLSPDDDATWTLRPQDLGECFGEEENTWYFPRVAGTFKERAGFHGCQMPEQLLGRIIRTCSTENDVVLDPFSGSATTLAVAKKLARRYVGFELSGDYAQRGQQRLASIRAGDRLDGSAEPLLTAPKTDRGRGTAKQEAGGSPSRPGKSRAAPVRLVDASTSEQRYDRAQLDLTLRGLVEAFRATHDGFSADRVVADPDLNGKFSDACRQRGLVGDARTWNVLLFRLRKSGKLAQVSASRQTAISWKDCDAYLFASEIALQMMLETEAAESVDEILCDPALAAEFDATAARFAPGFTPLEYRWAALKLRKQANTARSRGAVLVPPSRLPKQIAVDELDAHWDDLPKGAGAYLVSEKGAKRLYVGEALDLRGRLEVQFGDRPKRQEWSAYAGLRLQAFGTLAPPAEMLAWQSCLVKKYRPRLNLRELRAPR